MNRPPSVTIAQGITVTETGEATIDSSVTNTLFDLALRLEESTHLPVDIEHVVGAIVMASQQGDIDGDTILSADDSQLVQLLELGVRRVFAEYGGKVGQDE